MVPNLVPKNGPILTSNTVTWSAAVPFGAVVMETTATCYVDSHNVSRCPSSFPSGPSFAATFDRAIIRQMANVVGIELRAIFMISDGSSKSLDCWGPVIDLNR